MKKSFLACILVMMLTITGCSSKTATQTLFVEKNNKYALCTSEGDLKTKFIYSSYKKVENEGYIVVHDKKYEYISTTGKKLIEYKKGTKLTAVENMIVAKNDKNKYVIYDLEGKELYKDSKKVKIYMYDLPIIYQNKKYSVLNGQGEVVTTSKQQITYAGIYNQSFITVAYKNKTVLFDTSSSSQIDENGLAIKLKGQYDVIANDYKKGFVLYDQKQKNLAYVNLKGKVKFKKDIEVETAKFDGSSLILKDKDDVRLLSLDGSKDVLATFYFKNINNYLAKNASYIYGPHKFVENGKEKEVKGIQLNPNISAVHGKIFPVYVQNKGYQYYGFNGKEAIKTIYKDAQDFDQYGIAIVSKDGEKYYLMNSKGEKQSKNYVKIKSIGKGYYAAYETNSKYEIINTEGKIDIHDYFMGESQAFEFDGKVYALLNKSGTTYLYDMEENESLFSLEGEYQLYNGRYLRQTNHKAYYDLEGNLIYKG